MPSINLRLTEEQHAELEKWAHGAHRSLQREIIFRLFSMAHVRKESGAGEAIQAAAGFVSPQGREEAERVMTGKPIEEAIGLKPMTAPRGVCPMNTPAGTKCKACGKVHPL